MYANEAICLHLMLFADPASIEALVVSRGEGIPVDNPDLVLGGGSAGSSRNMFRRAVVRHISPP
jgi:hypothetical protein